MRFLLKLPYREEGGAYNDKKYDKQWQATILLSRRGVIAKYVENEREERRGGGEMSASRRSRLYLRK